MVIYTQRILIKVAEISKGSPRKNMGFRATDQIFKEA
jgi:hypothetical protein